MGLFAWSTGASNRFIDVLGHCGFTSSLKSISKVVEHLANSSINEAIELADQYPHGIAYDNVNMSHSEHVEQRPDGPPKVQSGTFTLVYRLYNARHRDMLIEPMLERLRVSPGLSVADITATSAQHETFHRQRLVHIVNILTSHSQPFQHYANDVDLRHIPQRPLPRNLKTKFCALRIAGIEENSTTGQILVQDDIYINQLKHSDPMRRQRLKMYAIPTLVDQLTLARCRSAVELREGDVDAWETREVLQLGMGLFHLNMNLLWGLLNTHRGSVNTTGSLAYFFAVLDKRRLAREKPDYHSLLMAMMQILDGAILNAWTSECGFPSLQDFADTKPTAAELLAVAEKIYKAHIDVNSTEDLDSNIGSSYSSNSGSASESDSRDVAQHNLKLLIRDLLYVRELTQAISDGDFGRIECIFPDLCRMFRGAGSTNYANEILHFLHSIKKVWTPAFA